jgi:hypothetical protein
MPSPIKLFAVAKFDCGCHCLFGVATPEARIDSILTACRWQSEGLLSMRQAEQICRVIREADARLTHLETTN